MSLLVHLPLLGDLRNIGLAGDITMTNHGATVNNTGKLGQCYEFDGTDDRIFTTDLVLGNMWSIAIWFKDDATTTTWGGICTLNSNGSDSDLQFGIYVKPSESRLQSSANGRYNSQIRYDPGRWNHIVNTFDGTTCKTYINGNHVNSFVGGSFLQRSNLTIGGRSTYISGAETGAGALFKGCLNDFRLYDHVLSLREIKELSKGLVAHWKLDDPYVEATQNLVTSLSTTVAQITRVDDTLVTSGANKDTYFKLNLGAALVAGTTYTVSMYCRGMADGGTATFGVGAQSGDNRAALWTVQNGYNECTFIVPTGLNGATSIMFDDTNRGGLLDHQAVFSQIQIEQKDHATGYIAWGTSRAKGAVYDSSGYCHDGTLSPTPPTFDSDSARYSGCMKFSSNYIHCGLSNLYPTDEITVAWWGYMDSWSSYGRAISCTESGGWNFEPSSGKIRFVAYKSAYGYGHALSETTLSSMASGWHFFVGTFDGYVAKIYVDGEYENVSTDASPEVKAAIKYQGNVPIYIGCEANGANPYTPYFNGKLSDIRIYATALSAEDIKELYNTSASIDNHHNVYAREFVED